MTSPAGLRGSARRRPGGSPGRVIAARPVTDVELRRRAGKRGLGGSVAPPCTSRWGNTAVLVVGRQSPSWDAVPRAVPWTHGAIVDWSPSSGAAGGWQVQAIEQRRGVRGDRGPPDSDKRDLLQRVGFGQRVDFLHRGAVPSSGLVEEFLNPHGPASVLHGGRHVERAQVVAAAGDQSRSPAAARARRAARSRWTARS